MTASEKVNSGPDVSEGIELVGSKVPIEVATPEGIDVGGSAVGDGSFGVGTGESSDDTVLTTMGESDHVYDDAEHVDVDGTFERVPFTGIAFEGIPPSGSMGPGGCGGSNGREGGAR